MNSRPGLQVRATILVWYREEDWDRILEIMTDAEKLPPTFEDWQQKAEEEVRQLESQGMTVLKAYIDPEEFIGWCAIRGMDIDAEARMAFANEMAFKEHGKTH